MDLKDFKAGEFSKQFGYRNFVPSSINKEWIISQPDIAVLLEQANLSLGSLNSFATIVPEIDSFLIMHVVKEATQSSRIEGTQTTIDEAVIRDIGDISPEKKDDWQEVQNYRKAINDSIDRLNTLPLSTRLIREAHKILMQGVRGKDKMPGEFRNSQNWIGGATLNDAKFIPPHQSLVPELMSDLERFLNNVEIQVPFLIRIGMAHYQFEAIHPFLDGNGRIGRLLITLYLVDKGVLSKPALYLSDFIEKNRNQYYDNLSNVSANHDMIQWLKFFLVGVKQTADQASDTLRKILLLRNKLETQVLVTLGKRQPNAKALLKLLYFQPIMTLPLVTLGLQVSKQTANALIKDFVRLNILKERTGFKRNRSYVFDEYLNFFKNI